MLAAESKRVIAWLRQSCALPNILSLECAGMRCHSYIAFVLLVFAAFPQTVTQSGPRRHQMVWEPPAWNFPQNAKASVPKEMLAKLRVSTYDITLEETSMEDAAKRFGGTIGSKGDAGDFLEWLCLHGTDAADDWVLWLESGEIDGGYVGSFQWQRIQSGAAFDARCAALPSAGHVRLPVAVHLGSTEADVLKALGQPTLRSSERLIYLHEQDESIRGEPYNSSNIVIVRVRNGRVWAIAVSKTTSS